MFDKNAVPICGITGTVTNIETAEKRKSTKYLEVKK